MVGRHENGKMLMLSYTARKMKRKVWLK